MTEAVYVIIIAPLVQGGSPANICQTKKRKCVRPNFGVNNNFKFKISLDRLTLIEAVHFWPYFNRGSPSRQSLGALGQTSIKSYKSLNGGGGGADAVARDEI